MKYANRSLTPGDRASTPQSRHVTLSQKNAVMKAYGVSLLRRAFYTIDHLIPLELNGTNSYLNLWPQPKKEAMIKDHEENKLARGVHNGDITLPAAQRQIIQDWSDAV